MARPKMILAGGSGFLGRHLTRHFTQLGYHVVLLSRRNTPSTVQWDGCTLGPWAAELEGAAVLLNMAGRSVDCRYTARNRAAITQSRIESTRVLGEAVAACQNPPAVWINSSTATIYEDTTGDAPVNTEATGRIGRNFSEMVAQQWEAMFWLTPTPSTRRIVVRTAIVLGADGGALPVMARLAKFGLSTPQSTGQQWVSWLHVQDFCRAIEFLIGRPVLEGTFNVCSPHPILNQELTSLLDTHYRPKWHIPQPKWLLEVGAFLLGTETELVLKSRKVVPRRLQDAGFQFRYPTCAGALADLLAQVA
ncbi:TIGR01777 family oxidoreductase [Hymenobacter mucosus]|uniref:DUF1731 domain-containing protein n=1 Tax=Hymenobacter mucosus TaxID=1411120 RepID=A0A238W6X8_9BACT|nr:TIGR01777 family oxidoreductase [Hymenobacter mucosus]SNR42345.1 hypothetical protein SAMN06269173_102291 [Hymenobacter mucosus]